MSKLYTIEDEASSRIAIDAAVDAVAAGRLTVLPTDTLYGIGCDAFNNDAVAQLLAAKRRGRDMPVPVLVGSWTTIQGLVGTFSATAKALVEAFWPGGLSIVVPEAPSLPWDLGDTRGTVLLRMPAHPVTLEILRRTGPMAVSSANLSGHTPPTTAEEAERQLGDAVAVYVSAGQAPVAKPSTIIDISQSKPRILREGAISAEQLEEVIGVAAATLRGI